MRIANRFSIGVHILSLLGALRDAEHTSEWMAGSIGVNPVVVRNVTGMLGERGSSGPSRASREPGWRGGSPR
jgi:DNA-binding IscR family transcriptional regulator